MNIPKAIEVAPRRNEAERAECTRAYMSTRGELQQRRSLNGEGYKLLLEGLWKNNAGLVQLLGLCPLLAVSTTFLTAFTLGLATLFVLICSNGLVASVTRFTPSHLRIPIFVLIIASFVTLTQIFLSAYFFGLYESLGIFLALITTNCVILGRAEAFASRNSVPHALLDGLANGLGFLAVLCLIGGLREFIGQYFLLALLPPGAFIILGVMIAVYKSQVFHKATRRG